MRCESSSSSTSQLRRTLGEIFNCTPSKNLSPFLTNFATIGSKATREFFLCTVGNNLDPLLVFLLVPGLVSTSTGSLNLINLCSGCCCSGFSRGRLLEVVFSLFQPISFLLLVLFTAINVHVYTCSCYLTSLTSRPPPPIHSHHTPTHARNIQCHVSSSMI